MILKGDKNVGTVESLFYHGLVLDAMNKHTTHNVPTVVDVLEARQDLGFTKGFTPVRDLLNALTAMKALEHVFIWSST